MPDITPDSVTIQGRTYVPADTIPTAPALSPEGWVMVRSRDAGVFAGRLDSRDGTEVQLLDARRIWMWAGAASLSQLATDGTSDPKGCKFPCPVAKITVLGVCEVIPMTAKAVQSIAEVPVWKQ